MKKLVLFDLDGTLINSIDDLADSANYALEKCGLPLHTVEEYKYIVGDGVDTKILRCLPPEKRENKELFQKVKSIYMPYYSAHSQDKTRPYPEIEALLSRCNEKGVLVAVVSNKPHTIATKVVEHYFPKIHFVATIGQNDETPKKPDPTGVKRVLNQTGVSPADALYVGDTCVDIQTAKNSGLPSCGVLWGFRTKEELIENKADFIATDVQELSKIIFS